MSANNIQSKVLIVKLSISRPGATMTDAEITSEVHEKGNMEDTAGRYVTELYPKDEFKVDPLGMVKRWEGFARRLVQQRTVISKWGYLLPTISRDDFYFQLEKKDEPFQYDAKGKCVHPEDFKGIKRLWGAAVDELDFEAILAIAKKSHGDRFRRERYPVSESVFKSEFNFSVFESPMARPNDMMVDYLTDEVTNQLRLQLEKEAETAAQQSANQVMARVLDCVQKMADKLASPDATFKNSLVENLDEILAIAPALNLSGNPEVAKVIAACQKTLVIDPEVLRQNKYVRKDTAAAAAAVLASFGGMGKRKLAA